MGEMVLHKITHDSIYVMYWQRSAYLSVIHFMYHVIDKCIVFLNKILIMDFANYF